MTINILTKKIIKVATDIHFNNIELNKIAYINNFEWTCKRTSDNEKFLELVKNETEFYNKLNKLKTDLLVKYKMKEINKEEYRELKEKINNLTD